MTIKRSYVTGAVDWCNWIVKSIRIRSIHYIAVSCKLKLSKSLWHFMTPDTLKQSRRLMFINIRFFFATCIAMLYNVQYGWKVKTLTFHLIKKKSCTAIHRQSFYLLLYTLFFLLYTYNIKVISIFSKNLYVLNILPIMQHIIKLFFKYSVQHFSTSASCNIFFSNCIFLTRDWGKMIAIIT